jgi:predicted PurR-regulated permease PerM
VRTQVDDCGQAGWQTLSGYTRGIIIIAFFDGLLVGIGLVILGVPLAAALAVVVMFGALIPVIGAPIATLFAAVVALATEGLWTALLVVALTVVVGSFDGDILQPLIMGHAVQLHPLAIVSVIAFGTLSFGIMGALLAVPIAGTVYSIAKYLTGRMPPPRLQAPRERHYPRWYPKRFRRAQPA